MKTVHILKTTAWVAVLVLLTACASSSGLGRRSGKVTDEQTTARRGGGKSSKSDKQERKKGKKNKEVETAANDSIEQQPFDREVYLTQVEDNAQLNRFLTSKVKLSVEVGNRQMTLTGNLKMKRDDVIRLQLMAFGFVEAGRLEFTKEYVMIVDRINKQYLKVPYAQLAFLRNSNIDFYTLQALFWNELHQPGTERMTMTNRQRAQLNVEPGLDNDVVLSMEDGKLSYRWLTEGKTARIKMTNILYKDAYRGNYQLNWDYEEFKANERKFFPTKHIVSFTTPDQEVKLDMKLNYLGQDEDWETRTELSGKYRQMPVDDILRRFMSL
ncbi:MAG: DUF4292 domain-containing protein [Prevotella sp.]|nr:DUF4292 domain-containing protein [Prevotella sp.]